MGITASQTILKNADGVLPGKGGVIDHDGKKVAIFKDKDGKIKMISARCTHMGCIVHWNGAENTWDCPCHGSRFDINGKVINGPAERDLEKVE